MSVYDEWAKTFRGDDARLARMHGYQPAMAINLCPPRAEPPLGYWLAWRRTFRRIRRETWTRRTAAGQYTLGRPGVEREWEGVG